MDEREWQINCFRIETGKTMVKESWINGKYVFLFAKGAINNTTQADSEENISFPADGHQAILNKENKSQGKTEKWTN